MKRFVLMMLFGSCILSRVLAQDDTSVVKTPEISLAGGVSFPYLPEQFRDYWKKGWNTEIGYGYSMSPGAIGYSSLLATIGYSRFAMDVTGLETKLNLLQKNISLTRNPTTVFTILLSYKGAFSPSKRMIAPYFLIGIGYLHLSAGAIGASGDTTFSIDAQSASAFTWTFGVGIELPVTERIALFVQGKSVLGVLDPTRQYFPLNGGFSYRFPN
jgi:opacity protein-like surface antigen